MIYRFSKSLLNLLLENFLYLSSSTSYFEIMSKHLKNAANLFSSLFLEFKLFQD